MRALTSLLLALLASLVEAEPFGRFGYQDLPQLPDFEVTSSGFRARIESGEWIWWGNRNATVKPVVASRTEAVYAGMRQANAPSKFRASLLAPGFRAFFPAGFQLKFGSFEAPLLSYEGATLGAGNPTPPEQSWILLTFQHSHPPLLMTFQEPYPELVVKGEPGEWQLTTLEPYTGWVRFALPEGHRSLRIRSRVEDSVDIGRLAETVQKVKSHLQVYQVEEPTIVDREIRSDQESITVVYRLSRARALAPPVLALAKAGGYPIEVLSPTSDAEADLLDGPTLYTLQDKLAVRFPMARIPTGRALVADAESNDSLEIDPSAPESVVKLAFKSLLGQRGKQVATAGETALNLYLSQAVYQQEPVSGTTLPLDSAGEGSELAAAYALLMQAQMAANGSDTQPNSLFTSLAWRRDWRSGLVWIEDPEVALRASAVMAVSAAFASDPERRLEAAWLQAGLSARSALPTYRERREFEGESETIVPPLFELRYHLFGLTPRLPKTGSFVDTLLSPLRVVGERPMTAQVTEEGVVLQWVHRAGEPEEFSLLTPFPVQVQPLNNLTNLQGRETLGTLVVRYQVRQPGLCRALLKVPDWADPLPPLAPMPTY